MHLISHVFHTQIGTVILATNHVNLQELYKFVVIELEPTGDGLDLTFHECDGSEQDALTKALAVKKEIDELVAETVPFDTDRV